MNKVLRSIEKKNILIAGGTGLVGTNLTINLKNRGASVLSTYYSKEPVILKECYKQFDFNRLEDCLAATRDMDYMIICAARSFGSKMMKENPTINILPNLKIYAGLLEASRQNNVKRVIFISSSTVYQEANYPISENQLDLNKPPYNLYFGIGWLNRYIEQLAKFYFKVCDMKIGIVRPTNIYGPYDKVDIEKSNVLPALIMRALKREDPYVVWGDGYAVRDFIYVDDFIDDILCILEKYCTCDPINLGSGYAITTRQAVDVILKVCKHTVVPQFDITKPTSIPYRMLNIAKSESVLGKRQRTPFGEGISKTVQWYKTKV